jgi:hypothetical protein
MRGAAGATTAAVKPLTRRRATHEPGAEPGFYELDLIVLMATSRPWAVDLPRNTWPTRHRALRAHG